MIIIEEIRVTRPMRYFWLKSVEGVNLEQHCAKSLIGSYDKRISSTVKQITDVQLDGQVYYLCGVSKPYIWAHNFHLAFRHKEGATLTYESNGVSVMIKNAERILFSDADIDWSLTKASKKEFNTCRNWQFANWYAKNVGADTETKDSEKAAAQD